MPLRSPSGSHPVAVAIVADAEHRVPPDSVFGYGPRRRWQTTHRSALQSRSPSDLGDLAARPRRSIVPSATSSPRERALALRSDRTPTTADWLPLGDNADGNHLLGIRPSAITFWTSTRRTSTAGPIHTRAMYSARLASCPKWLASFRQSEIGERPVCPHISLSIKKRTMGTRQPQLSLISEGVGEPHTWIPIGFTVGLTIRVAEK